MGESPLATFPFLEAGAGGGDSELRVGGCSHMAMNLRGGVGMDIFWNHKIYPSRYYIPFLHSPKQITFFHEGNNLRFGPSKYWSEICMKLSTQPWLVLLCMLTGEDGEKGLFAMQVGWFSVYLLKMCNTLYLKPLEHKTICSSDDMGNSINHKILSIFIRETDSSYKCWFQMTLSTNPFTLNIFKGISNVQITLLRKKVFIIMIEMLNVNNS